jgi:hypothetical protein
MIKTFIKHQIFEKCIDIIFDGITKAFKNPERRYEILNIETKIFGDGSQEHIATVKYKGANRLIKQKMSGVLYEDLLAFHNMDKVETDNLIEKMLRDEIEIEIRSEEVGWEQAIKEVADRNIEKSEKDIKDLTDELEKITKELKL